MSSMVRFGVNKLLRDNIPLLKEKNEIVIHQKKLDPQSFIAELKKKLIEEADEVRTAHDDTLLEELADVLEVMQALLKTHNYSWDQLEQIRIDKRAHRGGFDQQLYIEYVEVPIDSNAYRYMIQHPDKYPVIKKPRP